MSRLLRYISSLLAAVAIMLATSSVLLLNIASAQEAGCTVECQCSGENECFAHNDPVRGVLCIGGCDAPCCDCLCRCEYIRQAQQCLCRASCA